MGRDPIGEVDRLFTGSLKVEDDYILNVQIDEARLSTSDVADTGDAPPHGIDL